MKKKHLPLLGVGPLYGLAILILTVVAVLLSKQDFLASGIIDSLQLPLRIVAVISSVFGIFLYGSAVVSSKIASSILENKLVTTGVYAYVRNPLYTMFIFVCSGVVLWMNNLWLLFFPFIYWGILTLVVKNSEEKWLTDLYGQEYLDYCKHVNRCIPWFKH